MIAFEQDPDIARWGLHNLIHDCTLPNSGSCYAVTRHDRDKFNAGHEREYYNDPEYANNVENDAVIARALQEELSRIADAEALGLNNAEQESIIMQQWPGSHERYYVSGTRKFCRYSPFPWLFKILYSHNSFDFMCQV